MTDGTIYSIEFARGYLAAFFDGEGHIGCYHKKDGTHRQISCANTDLDLMAFVSFCLRNLDIPHKLYAQSDDLINKNMKKRVYTIHILGREGFEGFAKKIPIQSLSKRTGLGNILSSYYVKKEDREDEK